MGEHATGIRVVARVLIRNDSGELLLCRDRSGKSWVLPGGTLDPGEILAEAAVREALEEAGIGVTTGSLAYLQEFRPYGRPEHVVEAAFHARAVTDNPGQSVVDSRSVTPAGRSDRPWQAWFIQDVDGPRREVRWFSREQLATLGEPVFPTYLRDRYWEPDGPQQNLYFGLIEGK